MEHNRKTVIYGGLFLLIFFSILVIPTNLFFLPESTFYWGLLLGTIIGTGFCYHIHQTWDPVHLQPKNPDHEQADSRILWVIPLGVMVARVVAELFGDKIADFMMGAFLVMAYMSMGFFIIQAWRHRPRK